MAIEISEVFADAGQVDKPINGPQRMILRDVTGYRELMKQHFLCFLLWPQHRKNPQLIGPIESGEKPQSNKISSTE
jgi:hypothetical protein